MVIPPYSKEATAMKLIDRELWIEGNLGILYGFDWDTNEAIYRFVETGQATYKRISLEDNNND